MCIFRQHQCMLCLTHLVMALTTGQDIGISSLLVRFYFLSYSVQACNITVKLFALKSAELIKNHLILNAHLNSTARFTLIGTLNMWRNSFYAAFIAYNDANIDLRNEFHVLFTRNTQFSSTLATIYTMYEFQSYVIFTPLFKICFFSNSHACTSEF